MSTSASQNANYAVRDRDLKYYIFDWDNNILHMPTRIHLQRKTDDGEWVPHSVSTALFSVIRNDSEHYRPPNNDWESAFVEFRDISIDDENVFLRDTKSAIDNVISGESQPAPCFVKFRQTLIEGRLFAIVTARGHDPKIIQSAVRYFIETVLSDDDRATMMQNLWGYLACFEQDHALGSDEEVLTNYLSLNKYHGVMSTHFKALMQHDKATDASPEEGKQFAIKDFVEHVVKIAQDTGLDKPISVGFSDDDPNNLIAVEDYIREQLARLFPGIKFVVYDTSDPEVEEGRKVTVAGQLNLDI
ncbi:MAG: hypothetical protein ACI9OU_002820 [Candidatus Promineifilaceae bacterium]|jgi:hypothetical protein